MPPPPRFGIYGYGPPQGYGGGYGPPRLQSGGPRPPPPPPNVSTSNFEKDEEGEAGAMDYQHGVHYGNSSQFEGPANFGSKRTLTRFGFSISFIEGKC